MRHAVVADRADESARRRTPKDLSALASYGIDMTFESVRGEGAFAGRDLPFGVSQDRAFEPREAPVLVPLERRDPI